MKTEVKLSKRIVAAITVSIYSFLLIPISVFADNPNNMTQTKFIRSDIGEKSEVLISAKKGGVVTLGNATIEIPEGALKKDTKISITRLYNVEETGESLYNAIPNFGGYRFLPAGTKFEKDVLISLPYNPELNAKQQSLDDLYTYFYDTEKKSWVKLERVEIDKENHIVRSLSTHFTDMINATLTMPESASPVDVNLNSIKNLEAATPDSHLIKFNPPEANNMGDASFSFELSVPSGRHGMQPQLSIGYSSLGGNGIMGIGFDINYGSIITTDTRNGLPKYDKHDTYMLDGIILEEDPRKTPQDESYIIYKPLKEVAFRYIKRDMSDNHWEVTEKNGVKRIYEQNVNSCVGKNDQTFSWYLTKIIDTYQNTVVYEYNNFNSDNNTFGYVYPTAIYYTGKDNEKGKYSIKFHYDNDGEENRSDVHIDARSKQIVACKKLLTSVTTHYDDNIDAIRTYSFTYSEGLAKEKKLSILKVSNNADEHYEYTFDYVEPKYGNDGKIQYFGNKEKWSDDGAIKTGASDSGSGSFNTSGGVGVGELSGCVDARLTGGVQGSMGYTNAKTESMIVDIDGDGRPDYIKVEGSKLKYRLYKENGLSSEVSYNIESFKLDDEYSKNYSIGWNVYGGGGLNVKFVPGLGVTYSNVYQTSTSSTSVTLNDVNGDKKIDVILSGKNYYLKNTSKNGIVSFEKEFYDSGHSVVIQNNTRKLTTTEIEEYDKQYKVQTPFRQWKSKFDGKIKISQDVSITDKYDNSNAVNIHTYQGRSSLPIVALEDSVSKNKTRAARSTVVDVAKDENLYFIAETKEPLDADVNYNIKIDYTDIKAYKPRIPNPVFYPISQITINVNNSENKEAKEIAEEYFEIDVSSIYDIAFVTKETSDNNTVKDVICTLKDKWQKNADQNIYNYLISKSRFVPGAFTEAQFNQILNSISSNIEKIVNNNVFINDSEDFMNQKIFYERFSAMFVHDKTKGLYIVRDNNNKLFSLLFNVLNLKDLLKETWDNYILFDLYPIYSNEGLQYRQTSNQIFINTERDPEVCGSKIQNGSKLVLNRTDGKLLSISLSDKKVFCNNEELTEVQAEITNKEDGIAISLSNNTDNETVIYNFTNIQKKALNLTKDELQCVVNDYTLPGDSLNDEYWNVSDKSESEIVKLCSDYGMNDSQIQRFIQLVYNKEVISSTDNDNSEKNIVYAKKNVIKNQDFIDASTILQETKFNKITTNDFPFYELSSANKYILKDKYIENVKDNDSDERKKEEKLLIEKCDVHGFIKYCNVIVSILYNGNGLYKLNADSNIVTKRLVTESIDLQEKEFSAGQTKWDSSNAWDYKSHEDEIVLYSDTNNTIIQTECQEKLYEGNKNWFFGIWINGIKTFNGENIEEILSPDNSNVSSIEYDGNKLKSMNEEQAVSKKEEVKEQPFYLPTFNNVSSNVNDPDNNTLIYPVKTEYSTNKVDVENELIGQISMSCQKEEKEDGSYSMVTEYYFPFIKKDYIHSNRIGGKSFYDIDGIFESTNSNSAFVFPKVRMSENKGEDKAFGLNVNLNLGSINQNSIFETSVGEDIISGFESSSLGIDSTLNTGSNTNNGNLTQTVMDINGDSIPDIIQKSGNGIKVIQGKKTDSGISYGDSYYISGIDINSTSSNTKIKGASLSPTGSTSLVISVNGKVKGAIPSSSTSGGAGYTYVDGDSTVNSGLIDINGDGLPDYYSGQSVLINKGESFSDTKLFTALAGTMNKSSLVTHAVNLSVGGTSPNGESLSPGFSFGGGLSYSVSSNISESMYLDINGDGLVDKLIQRDGKISVLYNTGNSFVEGTDIELPSWNLSDSEKNDLHFNKDATFNMGSFNGLPISGALLEHTANNLPVVNFFDMKDIDKMEFSSTISISLSGNFGMNWVFPIKIPITFMSINATCSGGTGLSGSASINAVNVSLMDLDGDGLADHVLRIPGNGIYWKRNISGLYGKLCRINLPQGGNVEISYDEKYGTPDNPIHKFVMSKVTINDGTDGKGPLPSLDHGSHSVVTSYLYDQGYYDRKMKDFYGYGTVSTIFPYNNCQKNSYYNREYYSKGCVERSKLTAENGEVLSESTITLENSPYALPKKEESKVYEKNSADYSSNNNCINCSTEYEYDFDYGNCIKVTNRYDDSEYLIGEIEYKNITKDGKYIVGLPTQILVYGKDGKNSPLRLRTGDYYDEGQLKKLNQYWKNREGCCSENIITYDEYGNIETITDSKNAKLKYTYDDKVHMFVNKIVQSGTDTEEYISRINYDDENYAYQTKKSEVDCNGNTLRYVYDDWQRIKEIWTSYDTGNTPAVSYTYNNSNPDTDGNHDMWYAVTNNKVAFDNDESIGNSDQVIQTVIQIDGLGRAVRSAKTGFVNGINGWNVSGAVEYDEKGRTVKAGIVEFITAETFDENDKLTILLETKPAMTEMFTFYEYDEKDRPVTTILPYDVNLTDEKDIPVQTAEFTIKNGRLITEITDPLNNKQVQETDSRGNIVRVVRKNQYNDILTQVSYKYNEMGEMLKALDAMNNPVFVEYDMLGRRTALESKDSGRQEYFYDSNSNLVRENNSVLRENNKQIVYEYDGLNRLILIDYPDSQDTIYKYGKATDSSKGAAGKILKIEDESGILEYEYGKLGEIVKETRTLNTHLNTVNQTETAVMEYQSDYLGRMQWIIYPDGEKVVYGYDNGGQVNSVKGESYGHDFNYVTNILYDEYGQRTRIEYGNGISTDYTYDPARRWLDTIKTQKNDIFGNPIQVYQNIKYDFDVVGNVKGYINDCLDNVNGNYKTSQTYQYDDLYQLISVDGKTVYNPNHSIPPAYESEYHQKFEFDSNGLGNMKNKVSTETVTSNNSIGDNLNYSFEYKYDSNFAHRLISAGDRNYKYDSNGNIICEQDGSFDTDEQISYYRTNQEAEDVYSTDYGWGLYKDEVSDEGVKGSKYSRTYKWNERNLLISSIDATYNTSYVYGCDGQRSNKYTQNSETLYFNKMWTHHTDSGNFIYGGQTSKNIYLGETRIVTKLNSGNEPKYQEEYYKQYYYHSDHLGSASLITDYEGNEYQRIEYTPYGETWVEKLSVQNLNFMPYKFTGKELDEETGLYYYGARYLDPKYSMWISADPALGEYIPAAGKGNSKDSGNLPGMGGVYNTINFHLYHYAGNNPVKYTDPDGRKIRNSALNPHQSDKDKKDLLLLAGTRENNQTVGNYGCVFISYLRIAIALGYKGSFEHAMEVAVENNYYYNLDYMSEQHGVNLINKLLEESDSNFFVFYSGNISGENENRTIKNLCNDLRHLENSCDDFFLTVQISYEYGKHTMNINSNALSENNNSIYFNDSYSSTWMTSSSRRPCNILKINKFKVINTMGVSEGEKNFNPNYASNKKKNWAMIDHESMNN